MIYSSFHSLQPIFNPKRYTKQACKLVDQLKNIEDDIRKAENELSNSIANKGQDEVVRAFVIFENCLDKEIFLWSYANNPLDKGLMGRIIGQSEFLAKLWGINVAQSPLSFEGKLLKVEPAPEPSNVLWENVDGLPV